MRREFVLVLLAGAVGAGLVVLAARQAWAHAIFTPPKPLPAQDIAVTGQQLVPLASALALAALACLAAVIATRSGNENRSLIRCCTRAVYPARGPPTTPAAASGRCSRSTRCAARSPVVQPSHSVGASGPVSSSSAHRARRSSRE